MIINRSTVAAVLLAASGDAARQMAAQPLTPKTEPTKANRFDRLFTAVIFKASDSDKVFVNERSGQKSKKLASVLLEVGGSEGYLRGTIYAKQGRNETKANAEFSFFGANMQTCFSVEGPTAKAELDAWRAKVAADYKVWASQTGNQTTASINVGAALDLSI